MLAYIVLVVGWIAASHEPATNPSFLLDSGLTYYPAINPFCVLLRDSSYNHGCGKVLCESSNVSAPSRTMCASGQEPPQGTADLGMEKLWVYYLVG